ncbi:MAG: hypothetical protein L0G31_05435 [Kocuria sp.]|nr:hypothetical protein [Kocuria sp.]
MHQQGHVDPPRTSGPGGSVRRRRVRTAGRIGGPEARERLEAMMARARARETDGVAE